MNYHVFVCRDEEPDLLEGVRFVSSPKCGAIFTFSGTIRDTELKSPSSSESSLKSITAIQYEAYEPMVLKQLSSIINETINSPSVNEKVVDSNARAYVAIRLGRVPVQETSTVICVSSTSRHFSHEASMSILKKIKASAVIWKKIIYADGYEEWADISRSEAAWLKNGSFKE